MKKFRQFCLLVSMSLIGLTCSASTTDAPVAWTVPASLLTTPEPPMFVASESKARPTSPAPLTANLEFPLIQVPEPAAYALIGLGLVALSSIRPKRQSQR